MNLASRLTIRSSLLGVTALLAACSSSPADSNATTGGSANGTGSGGANTIGGSSGGSLASGGFTTGGANQSTGGANQSTGGATSRGGSSSGGLATGGLSASGGNIGNAGASSGGTSANGGSAGASINGGSPSLGGTSGSGGALNTGGTSERGGAAGKGGASSSGGPGSGGSTSGGNGNGGKGATGGNGGASATGGQATGGGNGGGSGAFQPCPASGVCKIMPLGDSITEGTGYAGGYRVELFAKAVADNKNITFVGSLSNGPSNVSGVTFPKSHEGHFGWTISQVDDLIPTPALNPAPHIVLLHLGTNDINQNLNSGAPECLASLVDQIITKLPSALIVVAKIIPEPSKASGITTFNDAIPAIVQTRANAGKHVILVDQFTGFPSSELGDGVHPNQAGYARMAGVWYTAIKGYLP